jgi:hypothetical protein
MAAGSIGGAAVKFEVSNAIQPITSSAWFGAERNRPPCGGSMRCCATALLLLSVVAAGCDSATSGVSAPTPFVVGLALSIDAVGDRSGLARTWGYQATASARYSDGSVQDVTNAATWTSSNAAVARITPTGTIIGEGPGITEIRATFQGVGNAVYFCLESDCL